MPDSTGKVVVSLLLMAGLWIGVYWWWPVEPPISYAAQRARPEPVSSRGEFKRQSAGPVTVLRQDGSIGPATSPDRVSQVQSSEIRSPPQSGPEPARLVRNGRVIGVIAPEFFEHTVGVGETFESISHAYYGTAEHAGAISASNGLMSAGPLRAGRVVRVPKDPRNVQGVPVVRESEPGEGVRTIPSEYVVQKGDVLGRIAQKVYGTSKYASLIYEANRDQLKSPDSVREGQMLRIPPLSEAKKEGR